MADYIDISTPLSKDTIIYPGDPAPEYSLMFNLDDGGVANVGQMKHGLHHGTHVDVPYHFNNNGKKFKEIGLDRWVGKALVIDATNEEKCISAETLKNVPIKNYKKILFKTKNSLDYYNRDEFYPEFIYLDKSACEAIVAAGVETVGLDYITVDPFGCEEMPAHNTLLGNEVCIIECINLKEVEPGEYTLYCLPLKLVDTDGANARAILVKKEDPFLRDRSIVIFGESRYN